MIASKLTLLFVYCLHLSRSHSVSVSDSLEDGDCHHFAKYGDHLLLEYSLQLEHSSVIDELHPPEPLLHLHLDASHDQFMVKGMCRNSTRLIRWDSTKGMDFQPFAKTRAFAEDTPITLNLTLHAITDPSDYEVFEAFKAKNASRVLHLINDHKGVNAVDEWGNTLLMLAVQAGHIHIISALLNSWRPAVDVNVAKAVISSRWTFEA